MAEEHTYKFDVKVCATEPSLPAPLSHCVLVPRFLSPCVDGLWRLQCSRQARSRED